MPRDETYDPRVDASWNGPTPRYAVYAALDDEATREEIVMYVSHSLAQTIDAAVEVGREGDFLSFPAGTTWDRDWRASAITGTTEMEVSFLLSDADDTTLRNAVNLALGLSVDHLIATYGPEFFASVSCMTAKILARMEADGATGGDATAD